jgi:hypothetical protein
MIFQLTDEWRIRTIPYNVVLDNLCDVTDFKTGEFIRKDWKEVGFYATVSQAIGAIPGHIVLDHRIETFDELLGKIALVAAALDARVKNEIRPI